MSHGGLVLLVLMENVDVALSGWDNCYPVAFEIVVKRLDIVGRGAVDAGCRW